MKERKVKVRTMERKYMFSYPQRIRSIMRNNKIYDSQIYNELGEKKKGNKLLDTPTPEQIEKLKDFFATKYSWINVSYILGFSNEPNNYVSLASIKYQMQAKGITVNQFNSYAESELHVKNCFGEIGRGTYPHTEEEGKIIMEYVNDIIDEEGNHSLSTPVEQKTRKNSTSKPKYETDPENYFKNDFDSGIIEMLIKQQGWNKSNLSELLTPGSTQTVSNLFNKNRNSLSIHKNVYAALQAAFAADRYYLAGKQVSKSTANHYWPKDDKKQYCFDKYLLNKMTTSDINHLCKEAKIAPHCLIQAKEDDNYYFFFTKKIADLLYKAFFNIFDEDDRKRLGLDPKKKYFTDVIYYFGEDKEEKKYMSLEDSEKKIDNDEPIIPEEGVDGILQITPEAFEKLTAKHGGAVKKDSFFDELESAPEIPMDELEKQCEEPKENLLDEIENKIDERLSESDDRELTNEQVFELFDTITDSFSSDQLLLAAEYLQNKAHARSCKSKIMELF